MTYYQEILQEVKQAKNGDILYDNESSGVWFIKFGNNFGTKYNDKLDTTKTYNSLEDLAKGIKKTLNKGA